MSLGLYVHLPFCTTHCTYCPFAISTDLSQQNAYTDALIREIASISAPPPASRLRPEQERDAGPTCAGSAGLPSLDTIYLGGGTPSRASLENLTLIVAAVRAHFAIDAGAEITMEANPEDVTAATVEAWRELGVNRISLGVQAFDDAELTAIGRIHDRAQALDAVRTVIASGARANLDLILGLPAQTAGTYRASLTTAIELGVGHLSLYMLDLDERTPLQVQVARGRVSLPEEDMVADLYLETVDRLSAAGLQQYEISNFARPGEESRHNLRYWKRDEYLGVGLGAHSFTGARRYANTRDMRRYIELSPDARDFEETLGGDEVRRETIFLHLRQTSGMCYEDLVAFCGQEGLEWLERGLQGGWLQQRDGRVAFTGSGFLQSNEFISQLF